MKREIILSAVALLISVTVSAQVVSQAQNKTKLHSKTQNSEQVQASVQDQEQVKARVQSGDPVMTQSQSKTQTKTQNHGEIVSETAKQAQSGEVVREQAKLQGDAMKAMKQNKTATNNSGAAKNIRTNRPATIKGTGTGRR